MVLKMKNIFGFSSKPLQNVIYQANRDSFYMPIIVVKQIYDRQLNEKVVAISIVEAPYRVKSHGVRVTLVEKFSERYWF